MSSRGIWGRVRERLERFPELLASCGEQASVYGRCIASNTTGHGNLRKDLCAKEFEMLMDCFTKADIGLDVFLVFSCKEECKVKP